jgi:hypothetical protein
MMDIYIDDVNIKSLKVSGIDKLDFSHAIVESGSWKNGNKMTKIELLMLQREYPCLFNQLIMDEIG